MSETKESLHGHSFLSLHHKRDGGGVFITSSLVCLLTNTSTVLL